jgi:hypothetical protein
MPHPLVPYGASLLFLLELGPYQLRVERLPKAGLGRGNENSENDYNAGCIRIAEHLTGKALLDAFVVRLIEAIHYTHGLDDASTEEHFTHSFAAGVLEFASRNPAAWTWLNSQMTSRRRGAYNYAAYASGQSRWRASAPQEVLVRPHVVDLASLAGEKGDREGVWGYYLIRRRGVRLHEELTGRHLAVIVLHELTHAFHHAARMRTRETRRRFTRVQAQAWQRFVRDNPEAWCWFLSLVRSRRSKAQSLWPVDREA